MDKKAKAQKDYDHYRALEVQELSQMTDADWFDPEKIKSIALIQQKRAKAGHVLGIGRYGEQ